MNHDYSHCADYDKKKCPKECFRGELVRDLVNYRLPVSFMHFKGTEQCMLDEGKTLKLMVDISEELYNKAKNGELTEFDSMYICGKIAEAEPLNEVETEDKE